MVTKKSILNKILEIRSTDEILEVLESKRIVDNYPGFSAYVSVPAGKGAEFRAEVASEKIRLELRPVLHPSRRLVEDRNTGNELLVCPHIAEPLASDLRKAGIAHADLNGRLFLRSEAGLVDIRPGEIRYRSPKAGTDPFSPKASRILRTLLCRRDAELTQEELERLTGVSRTLVSQVLGQLTREGQVRQIGTSAPGRSARYQLADFEGLLGAWQRRDDWRERVTIHEYSVLSNKPEEIARKLLDAVGGDSIAFTQWFAAWLRRPHTTPPVVSAYVKKRHVLEIAPARRVSSGGNLWLIVPADEGVWQEGQQIGDFPLVSDVQIYLDLLQVGQRGPETAAELRQWEGFAR